MQSSRPSWGLSVFFWLLKNKSSLSRASNATRAINAIIKSIRQSSSSEVPSAWLKLHLKVAMHALHTTHLYLRSVFSLPPILFTLHNYFNWRPQPSDTSSPRIIFIYKLHLRYDEETVNGENKIDSMKFCSLLISLASKQSQMHFFGHPPALAANVYPTHPLRNWSA